MSPHIKWLFFNLFHMTVLLQPDPEAKLLIHPTMNVTSKYIHLFGARRHRRKSTLGSGGDDQHFWWPLYAHFIIYFASERSERAKNDQFSHILLLISSASKASEPKMTSLPTFHYLFCERAKRASQKRPVYAHCVTYFVSERSERDKNDHFSGFNRIFK